MAAGSRLRQAADRGAAKRGSSAPPPPRAEEAAPARRASERPAYFLQHSTFVREWHRYLKSKHAATVWHYLFDIACRDGSFAFVGYERIAKATGVPKRTVQRAVKELLALGVVEVERPEHYFRGQATGYRIPHPMPKAAGMKGGHGCPPYVAGKVVKLCTEGGCG